MPQRSSTRKSRRSTARRSSPQAARRSSPQAARPGSPQAARPGSPQAARPGSPQAARPGSPQAGRRQLAAPKPGEAGRRRALALLDRLRTFYGALPSPPSLPFAIYIWEVLSVGTTPARRDAAFAALNKVPALTNDAIARVPQARLEAAVALAGPMKDERVRALRAGADLFRRNPSILDDLAGPATRALRATKRIPHLGRASSHRMLLFSRDVAVLPLDEPALRVALRLGYGSAAADRPIVRVLSLVRQALMRESGRDAATLRLLSQYFTHHGLSACTETTPHCTVCPLASDCEWIRRQ